MQAQEISKAKNTQGAKNCSYLHTVRRKNATLGAQIMAGFLNRFQIIKTQEVWKKLKH